MFSRWEMEVACAKLMILALVLGSIVTAPANAQLSGTICDMTNEGLASCKPVVTGLNHSALLRYCCLALSSANLPCLCLFKNSKFLSDNGINFIRTMELSALCGVNKSFHC